MNYTKDRIVAAAWAQGVLADPRTVVLDTETTDLAGYLVQIAVIDRAGAVLLDTLVNPLVPISAGAKAIHRLGPEQLVGAPTFADVEPELARVLHDRCVIVYNAGFDKSILTNELVRLYRATLADGSEGLDDWTRAEAWMERSAWSCAMHWYAAWVGQWRRGAYRWQPLPGGDHSALGDAKATLDVLRRMAGSEEK